MPRFLLILLALGLLFAARAHAEDAVIVCTPPTTNTDDTPVALSEIRLYGAISNTVRQSVPAGQPCRFVESSLSPGVHSWYMTAVSLLGESVPSNPVSKTVVVTPPPPTFATISTVVYSLVAGADTFAPLIVGTVPLGTPCNASQKLLAYNVIPRSAVTFTGPIHPVAVVALCGP